MAREIRVGQRWKRRVVGADAEPMDELVVTGLVDYDGARDSEYSIAPANEFGPTITTVPQVIWENYELVQQELAESVAWHED